MTASTAPPAETAGYFGPATRPLFGWRHAGDPRGEGRGWGIVFCSPLGYEAVPVHRTIRHAARAAAQRGCATLRFDYDGSGDSAGDDLDPARLSTWLASISAAIDELRQLPGVERIALWGVRAGALLAASTACARADVAALVGTAPVTDGARYLREVRALAVAGQTPALGDGLQEAAGYLTTEATRAELGGLSLQSLTARSALHTLWQPRDDLPFDDACLETWRAGGAEVAVQPFAGFEAMMRDPHRTEIPVAAVTGALDWLLSLPVTASAQASGDTRSGPGPADWHHDWPATALVAPGVRETALIPDNAPGCFAILSEPLASPASRDPAAAPLLVLLNAGSVLHIGPNRMHVQLARLLAAQGIRVARLDLPGIGDAQGHADAEDNHPYSRHALSDLQATLRTLAARHAPSALYAAGLCSGAYHALKLAAAGSGLASVAIVNPLTFDWREGMVVTMPESKVIAESARYQRRAFEWSAWLKLLRGEVALGTLTRVLARRVAQVARRALRAAPELVGLRLRGHLDRTLAAAVAQGVRMHFLFADTDPGLAMLLEQAPRTVRELQAAGWLDTQVFTGADHTFSFRESREALIAALRAWMLGAAQRAP